MPPLSSSRLVVHTGRAPAAVGPYSQAICVGDLVFASGQVGLDPQTRTIVAGGVAAETRQALANLTAVLEEAGASLETVLKTTVFLADMADFGVMNEVYATRFGSDPPARSTVAVLGLPLGARVEIEAVAHVASKAEP